MNKLSIVCFSINNWEKRRARKQQFMLHLSKRDDVEKVLYVEPPLNLFRLLVLPFLELKTKENQDRWKRALTFRILPLSESQNLSIFTPVFFIPFFFKLQFIYDLNLYISFLILKYKLKRLNFNNTVLWLYHPFDYCLLKWFKNRVVSCFDWAEEWAEYFIELPAYRRRQILKYEDNICKGADIIFTVSKSLLKKANRFNEHSYQIADGTVPEIFSREGQKIPEDIKPIRKPVAGYIGTVTERFDTELLKISAEKFPDVSFVLIGDVHYNRINISALKNMKNVYFLGGKRYEELGSYTQNFDVCILPYKCESSLYISPTKIFDYLATGKPVVSAHLKELEGFSDLIKLARNKEQFINYLKESLGENDPQKRKTRIEKAKENSWSARTEEIVKILQSGLYLNCQRSQVL